jgi:hypothetical protein
MIPQKVKIDRKGITSSVLVMSLRKKMPRFILLTASPTHSAEFKNSCGYCSPTKTI